MTSAAPPSTSAARRRPSGEPGGCLLAVLALALGVPLLVLCGLTLMGPPTLEAILFTIALALGVGGALVAPWRRSRALVVGGFALGLAVVGYRFVAAAGGSTLIALTGPGGGGSRWTDRIAPERDVALGGVFLLKATGTMPADQPGLVDALRDGYDRMRQAEGPVPSAVVGTFIFGQSAEEHSLLRLGPPRRGPPEAAVVFLHGYIGSLTLICWQVAQGANPVGLDVVCPAMHQEAEWASEEGEAIVRATIAGLRAEGVRRIYLAGLSAGAIGASLIARRMDIDGVILISGASSRGRPPAKPVLVLHGARDRMTPPSPARAYARAARGRYEPHPEAGHWLILSHHEWATQHLRAWLAEQEGLGQVHGAQ
jgi:pimeloyl-ACP methyl ester carboxylesterase